MIDQHAAHEKVLYERFMKELEQKKIMTQYMNPPIILSLSMWAMVWIFQGHEFF